MNTCIQCQNVEAKGEMPKTLSFTWPAVPGTFLGMLSESCCGLCMDSQAASEACVVLLHSCPDLEIILEHLACQVAKIACICLMGFINKNYVIKKGKTAKT